MAPASPAPSKWCLPTGRSILAWHEENKPASVELSRVAKVFLMPERDELIRRIDTRFDVMMQVGAIEEVGALAARRVPANMPIMKALGVPWVIRYLRGELTYAQAAAGGKLNSRQFAKRQATWFRNQLPEFVWVAPGEAQAAVEAQLRELS